MMEEVMSSNTANLLFIHLIPTSDNTILLFGYHRSHKNPNYLSYIKRWENANISDIGHMLTGILIFSVFAYYNGRNGVTLSYARRYYARKN
jgi:hypothetical protein